MKKSKLFVAGLMAFSLLCSAGTVVSASASTVVTTNDWRPHKFVLDGEKIETKMTANEDGTLTFTGNKTAGYASQGFNLNTAIEDISNFNIDMDFTIPAVDKVLWISFCFLDTNTIMDRTSNTVAPVAQPYNAMSGYGGYTNAVQNGAIFQLWPAADSKDYPGTNINFEASNTMRVAFAEKTLDCRGNAGISPRTENNAYKPNDPKTYENGYGLQSRNSTAANQNWHELTDDFISYIKLDNGYNEDDNTFNLKLSITPDGSDGVKFNVNNGNWRAFNAGTGAYDESYSHLNISNKLAGFRNYFEQNDCYFSMVVKYQQAETMDRTVSMKVKTLNGQLPHDGSAATYADGKQLTKDNVKMALETKNIGAFGVYPSQVSDLKLTKYDDTDDYYPDITSAANRTSMEILDYMTIEPVAGKNAVPLAEMTAVNYTLPEGYTSAKVYYVDNNLEQLVEMTESVSVSNSVLTFSVDNKTVKKVAILATKKQTSTGGNNTGNNDNGGGNGGGNQEEAGGCGSVIGAGFVLPLTLAGAFVAVKKRKNK